MMFVMTEQEMQKRVEAIRKRLKSTLTQQDKERLALMDERIADRMSRDVCGWGHQKDSK